MLRPVVPLLAVLLTSGISIAQQTKIEVTSRPDSTDTRPNSKAVPDVYAITSQFERVVVLRFKHQTDLLAGLERMVKKEEIHNAVILAGTGSVRTFHFHVVPIKECFREGYFGYRRHCQHEWLRD